MTYQELQNILRGNQINQGVPTALTIDQIISGIQSQYQPQQFSVSSTLPSFQPPSKLMPSVLGFDSDYSPVSGYPQSFQSNQPMLMGQYGQRPQDFQQMPIGQGVQQYGVVPQTFSQSEFVPVSPVQQSPSGMAAFKPGAFDAEQYRYKPPATVSEVIDAISPPEGGGEGSGGPSNTGIDGTGLTQSENVTPNEIGVIAGLISMVTGLPANLAANILGKNTIADAINAQNHAQDVANNMSVIGQQLGLDPADPANQAAIAAAIDSTLGSPLGQTAATPGQSGTGGSAAQAAQDAAEAAAALGMSPAAIGAASQAAANAAMQGATPAQQAQAGQVAAANADAAGMGPNGYGSSPTAVGPPTAEQAAQQAPSLDAVLGLISEGLGLGMGPSSDGMGMGMGEGMGGVSPGDSGDGGTGAASSAGDGGTSAGVGDAGDGGTGASSSAAGGDAGPGAAGTGNSSGDGAGGGAGGAGCVIATHAVNSGAFTKQEKLNAVKWCIRYLHGKWWGEAIRRGYRYCGNKAISQGKAANHYQEFKDYVNFATGKHRSFKTGLTFVGRSVQFLAIGLFLKD